MYFLASSGGKLYFASGKGGRGSLESVGVRGVSLIIASRDSSILMLFGWASYIVTGVDFD